VGNTGFGLGNTDSVAFSEELMADFAGNLDGSVSIGAALANAKQAYYLGRTAFSSYDEKTLSEAELYGLPMYGVGVAPSPVGTPAAGPPAAPDPVRGASSSTSPSAGALTALPATSAQVAAFDVVPSFTPQSGSHGQYLTNAGQVQAPNYRPLQPFVTLSASRAGKVAHGVLVDGLTSSDLTPFNPDNVRPTLDLSASEPEPQFADEAWPTMVPTLISLDDANGLRQNLNLTTGQFFTESATHAGVERQWTHIAGRVTYSSSSDFAPPTVDMVDGFLSGGTVTFSGHFSDLTETGAAGTVAPRAGRLRRRQHRHVASAAVAARPNDRRVVGRRGVQRDTGSVLRGGLRRRGQLRLQLQQGPLLATRSRCRRRVARSR